MWSIHPYVYVNGNGLASGFDDPTSAVEWFIKRNFAYNREPVAAVERLVSDGILRLDEDRPDCSPRHAALIRNDDKLPLEAFVNAHLWTLPRSMEYLRSAMAAWELREGPRVGDYCFEGRKCTRFTHAWDDGLQTGGGNGSFWIGNHGLVSYSGGLDPVVPYDKLEDTCTRRWGEFWFFKDGWSGAHRGISCLMPVRVYRVKES